MHSIIAYGAIYNIYERISWLIAFYTRAKFILIFQIGEDYYVDL